MLIIGQRRERETKKAMIACNDYIRMGPGRSLEKLHRSYIEYTSEKPPTRHLRTLAEWSRRYGWQARADDYDLQVERKKAEAVEARRQRAMEAGFALDYERVTTLKKLSALLLGQIFETTEAGDMPNLWLEDFKQIGGGEFAEKVRIERYNSAIIDNLRGLFDDLAKETGGRKQIGELDVNLAKRIDFFEVEEPARPEGDGE